MAFLVHIRHDLNVKFYYSSSCSYIDFISIVQKQTSQQTNKPGRVFLIVTHLVVF